MLGHQIKHFELQNCMLTSIHPFRKLLDLKHYHLKGNNVKFKEMINLVILVCIQNQILESFYHDHNLIIFHLQTIMLININLIYYVYYLCNVMKLD